jgi:hypothetical protein
MPQIQCTRPGLPAYHRRSFPREGMVGRVQSLSRRRNQSLGDGPLAVPLRHFRSGPHSAFRSGARHRLMLLAPRRMACGDGRRPQRRMAWQPEGGANKHRVGPGRPRVRHHPRRRRRGRWPSGRGHPIGDRGPSSHGPHRRRTVILAHTLGPDAAPRIPHLRYKAKVSGTHNLAGPQAGRVACDGTGGLS